MNQKIIQEIKKMRGMMLEIEEEKDGVVLCALVNDKQEVLLFKRHPNESTNPGKWGFLGGHIEKGETQQQALSREIKEETKLNFSKFTYLDSLDFEDLKIYIYCKKVKKNFIPKLNREHINWNWFSLNNLPEPIFDNVKLMTEKAFKLYGIKKNINENRDLDDNLDKITYDYYERHDEKMYDAFNAIAKKEKMKITVIPKNPYHTALKEFVKYGEFIGRFPVAQVFRWKEIVINNAAMLDALNSINGHSQYFPFDEFYDMFDYNFDSGEDNDGEYTNWLKMKYKETKDDDYLHKDNFNTVWEFLDEEKNADDYLPSFSNGHYMISDFGLKPILALVFELMQKETAEEIIVVINKILDVTHPRSDLAEIFIEGGSKSLDFIAQYGEKYEYR